MNTTPQDAAGQTQRQAATKIRRHHKPRTRFEEWQVERLMIAYEENTYPSKLQKANIVHNTKLPLDVVRVWFQNRRGAERKSQARSVAGSGPPPGTTMPLLTHVAGDIDTPSPAEADQQPDRICSLQMRLASQRLHHHHHWPGMPQRFDTENRRMASYQVVLDTVPVSVLKRRNAIKELIAAQDPAYMQQLELLISQIVDGSQPALPQDTSCDEVPANLLRMDSVRQGGHISAGTYLIHDAEYPHCCPSPRDRIPELGASQRTPEQVGSPWLPALQAASPRVQERAAALQGSSRASSHATSPGSSSQRAPASSCWEGAY